MKFKDRPQIAEPVFHGSSGQRDAGIGSELLHRPSLFGARILDRLRLVENCQLPRRRLQPRQPSQEAVARDNQIHVLQSVAAAIRQLLGGRRRRMGDEHLEAWRESGNLFGPVGE
jgi:hypothetical protein